MKPLPLLLFCLVLAQSVFSQNIDSLVFTQIAEQVRENYFNGFTDDENSERRGDCIFGKKEGFTLSCIYSDWDLSWTTDFDGDSIKDVIVQITDEGLGGGGNMFGYTFQIVTLDGKQNIKEIYPLFGGGKFSYAHLSIDSVANGKIYATYTQNPYAYNFEKVNDDNKEQLNLEFLLEDNQLQEKNYKKCPIAEMNKNIFRVDLDFKIDRSISLDDSFNAVQEEILHLNDHTNYFASISGCEDIDLFFTHTIPYNASLEKDKATIKQVWLEHLLFLKENTRYKTILDELSIQLSALESKKIIRTEYGGADHEFVLSKNWKAYLFASGNEEQGSFISLRFIHSTASEQLDFWESLKRKNNL